MARWTKDGWELLEGIAFNAYAFTGFKMSALKVIDDAKRVCSIAEANPGIGKNIKNILVKTASGIHFMKAKFLFGNSMTMACCS
jgi:hypothetical protein